MEAAGKRTYRSLQMEGEEIEFSDGFTDLHTKSYQQIMDGQGFGLAEAIPAIQLVHDIRHGKQAGLSGDYHPLQPKRHPVILSGNKIKAHLRFLRM
jgi:UDP-N-acetyl-2-amino-2-deoxyglucuronate dehydrogenase